jgi:DNA-binding NarL/FixJ family response regulator
MAQQNHSLFDDHSVPSSADCRPPEHPKTDPQAVVAGSTASEPSGAAIERQLNGPLTALMLYMGEIKQHSDKLAKTVAERQYLQAVVENALQQTERVCALVKQISGAPAQLAAGPADDAEQPAATRTQAAAVAVPVRPFRKPLTRRESEVLQLISEGYSNKQGALRMGISPRTFESHRAEAMRKLGARNTADLVRAALLISLD